MPRIGCSTCQVEYRIREIGVPVLEMAGPRAYRLWSADEYQCPVCGARALAGYADKPIESFDLRFVEALEEASGTGRLRILYERPEDVPEEERECPPTS
jgi:hypothetical protein